MKSISALLDQLESGESLNKTQIKDLIMGFLREEITGEALAVILGALRMRALRGEELGQFASVLRSEALPFPVPESMGAIDVCGTGGDGSSLYNVSTAVSIVLAALGVPVLKHGNRAVSGSSGSADALQALKVNLPSDPKEIFNTLKKESFSFLFAPDFHPAFKKIAPLRKAMGCRTLFNFLGPLLNPGKPPFQLIGVPLQSALLPMAEAILSLGIKRAWIVHGSDGLDEVTISGSTSVLKVENQRIEKMEIKPEDWGVKQASLDSSCVSSPEESARLIERIFSNEEKGTPRDLLLMNVASALLVCGKVKSGSEGVVLARESIDSGKASEKLKRLQ